MNIGLILLGAAAGVLTGMAAGGGTVLVPGLVLLFGIGQHRAQGAVLAAFLVTQATAALGQWRQGNVKFRLAWWMVAGAVVGAVGGALLAARTRAFTLRQIYGWYLLLIGAVNWLNMKDAPAPAKDRH